MSDLINYLFMNDPGFQFNSPNSTGSLALGVLSWLIGLLVAGIVMLRMAAPKNALRAAFRRRTAIGLLVLSGLGLVNMLARMFKLDVVEWRFWTYLIFLVSLGFVLYSVYVARSVLPARVAAAGRKPAARPRHTTAPGTAPVAEAPTEPRPVATTGRRDARRSKKRRR